MLPKKSFSVAHARRRPRPGRRDSMAGVTAVEYAMGGALVLLALFAGIHLLERASRDSLEARAASAGAPDLGPGVTAPPTTAAPTTAVPADPGTTTPPSLTPVASLTASSRKDGSDWVATVVVEVTDPTTGRPVPRVSVTAQWTSGYVATTSCVTSELGTCPMSSAEIDRTGGSAVSSVALVVTGISGDGVTYTQTPPSITVTAAR